MPPPGPRPTPGRPGYRDEDADVRRLAQQIRENEDRDIIQALVSAASNPPPQAPLTRESLRQAFETIRQMPLHPRRWSAPPDVVQDILRFQAEEPPDPGRLRGRTFDVAMIDEMTHFRDASQAYRNISMGAQVPSPAMDFVDLSIVNTPVDPRAVVLPGSIYAASTPEHVGAFPVRQELTALAADAPDRAPVGWSMYEDVGTSMVNPRAVGRVTLPQFEVVSSPTVRLDDVRARRFNLVDRESGLAASPEARVIASQVIAAFLTSRAQRPAPIPTEPSFRQELYAV